MDSQQKITDDVFNLFNIPLDYIEEIVGGSEQHPIFPRTEDITVTNQYWQRVEVDGKTFNLMSAFYDDRPLGDPFVRLLAMSKDPIVMKSHEAVGKNVPVKIFCQYWFRGQENPIIEMVTDFRYLWWVTKAYDKMANGLFKG